MFKELQEEHKIWALKNFGIQENEDYALGMIEEVGELAHAILKRKQGIRNNENHGENIKDAIGDIVIYLIGFCNQLNINIDDCKPCFNGVMKQGVLDVSEAINELISEKDSMEIDNVLGLLIIFCDKEGIDFEEAVFNTWNNIVSKRDWKKNPDCITEKEAKEKLKESGFRLLEKNVNNRKFPA